MGKGWPPPYVTSAVQGAGDISGQISGAGIAGVWCDRAVRVGRVVRVGGGWTWEFLHITPGVVHGWGATLAPGGALRAFCFLFSFLVFTA